jgi:predicted alpha/beta-fold hydrolase
VEYSRKVQDFEPLRLLRNPHSMTIAAAFWPRRYARLPVPVDRLIEVEPGTRILARCHWQAEPKRPPTLVVVHGLEGSAESGYMLGTAERAFVAGFNVVRLNQRNCGGTEQLTPTLYNSSLSGDVLAVARELIARDGLAEIFAAGFSMGGNLVLKMAGELGAAAPAELRAVVAISPSLDLAACADALARPQNFVYQWHFVTRLKRHMRRKALLFPERYPLDGLARVRSVREFDEVITAPHCGFRDADDYYARASARRVVGQIRVPTLILIAQDDPMIPFDSFRDPAIAANPCIELLAPQRGGHCAFVSRRVGEERFWAEARIVEFCQRHSKLAGREAPPLGPVLDVSQPSAAPPRSADGILQ